MASQPQSVTKSDRSTLSLLQQAIVTRIGEARYQLWFAPHTRFSLHGDRLTVGVPNLHFQDWLNKTFGEAVHEAACEVCSQPVTVSFVIDAELFRAARAAEEQTAPPKPVSKSSSPKSEPRESGAPKSAEKLAAGNLFEPEAEVRTPPRGLKKARRWHVLPQFIVGACNRVAFASAQSVVEEPGEHANPLVLHGPVGTGKTHLLEGIYVGLRKSFPEAKLCFITAEDFTNRFVQAVRFGKLGSFRKFFRDYDAVLMDDMHFLAKKPATQEEFLHTFDALVADGKQIVMTCDSHPRLSEELQPELLDRLLGGAIWGLQPPDAQTRLEILRAKSLTGGTAIPDDVLTLLAETLRGNVRELEGAINSVRHYSKATGQAISIRLAREALGELLRHAVRVVQLADVERAVSGVLRLPGGALRGKGRAWSVSHPRMLAVFLARKHTTASYTAVNEHFGGKGHSGAVAAEKKVRAWLSGNESLALGERDWPVRDLIERIERDLLG